VLQRELHETSTKRYAPMGTTPERMAARAFAQAHKAHKAHEALEAHDVHLHAP
jgi:hypothetical protein